MKVALIPPNTALAEFGMGDFHLLLSHLLLSHPAENYIYRAHYKKRRSAGAYIVLDNSAHESGAGENPTQLAELAKVFRADEVVVPDVLFDSEATISAAIKAHEEWYESDSAIMYALDPRLMYVPQGRTKAEWAVCLNELTRMHIYSSRIHEIKQDFTLGVSKDYEQWNGGLTMLFHEYVKPLRDKLDMDRIRMSVHLLGWGRDLWELGRLAKEFPWIRSVDSAKPFVYGMARTELVPGFPPPPYPGRPKNYFHMPLLGGRREAARFNVKIFKAVAEGRTSD